MSRWQRAQRPSLAHSVELSQSDIARAPELLACPLCATLGASPLAFLESSHALDQVPYRRVGVSEEWSICGGHHVTMGTPFHRWKNELPSAPLGVEMTMILHPFCTRGLMAA